MRSLFWIAAGCVAVVLSVFSASQAEAKGLLFKSAKAEKPAAEAMILASSYSVAAPEAMPAPDVGVIEPGCAAPVPTCVCCPTPCIRYRNALLDRRRPCCDPCKPPIKAVLCVANPCTCCPVNVPVCLPSCCCGEPKVSCKKVLLGDGVVTYAWCCGVSVSVRFDRCGDVLVTYRGT